MKNVFLKFRTLAMMMMALGLMVSCDDDDDGGQPQDQPESIAAEVQAAARFSILADALDRTQLLPVLTDESASLTVFAPNNTAFEGAFQALGVADLDGLENAIGNDGLKQVLLYHVLGMEVESMNVTNAYVATQATNADGDNLSLYTDITAGVQINGSANVVAADIDASNGVIHEIDGVLLPMSIFGLLQVNPDFSSLVTALEAADGALDTLLSDASSGPFTLFAPDDAAFTALLTDLGVNSLNELITAIGGTDVLADILLYHVVPGNITADEVSAGTVTTAEGTAFTISTTGGVSITDGAGGTSNVTQTDIQGTNGVIHQIDGVLLIQ